MTFHERFGELPMSTLRCYKANNVSQSDHDMLQSVYGDDFKSIEAAVKTYQLGDSGKCFDSGKFLTQVIWS